MKESFDGLVIRESSYGDSDVLLTVLTSEHGKITLTAKGARSQKSKLSSLRRLFTYANFECYEKYGKRWISGGSVNESFFGLGSDIVGFALASYIIQLASELSGEEVRAENVLRVTLNTLYAIEKKLKPHALIKCAYEIFAAEESGITPDTSACAYCGCTENGKGFWLDVMNGRVVCAECHTKNGAGAAIAPTDSFMTQNILVPIDEGCMAAWQYVSRADPKRIFAFSLTSSESMAMLVRATETYIVNHLEKSFEALEFYNGVKE